MARIAVLIPVYNAARFLPHTLECLRKQTFQDFSVTAADDGSDDGSLEILRSFPEVQVLALPHGGVAKARNALLAASSGEYVAFLDADDLWDPDKLEKQAAFLDEHPEYELVMSGFQTFLDAEVTDPDERQKEILNAPFRYALEAALIRRSLFAKIGNFMESLDIGEDLDWLIRASTEGVDINISVPETKTYYRIHNTNTMLSAVNGREKRYRMIAAAARAGRRLSRRESGKDGKQ